MTAVLCCAPAPCLCPVCAPPLPEAPATSPQRRDPGLVVTLPADAAERIAADPVLVEHLVAFTSANRRTP
jgi:hypothetical protein